MAASAGAISARSAFVRSVLHALRSPTSPQRTTANPADGGEPVTYHGAYALFCRLAERAASTPII